MPLLPASARDLDRGLVAGFGVLAVMIALSIATPAQLIGIFAGAGIVASLLTTVRRTAVVAVAALLAAFVSAAWQDNAGTFDWFARILMCAVLGLVAVQNAALRARREDRLERMTVIAETAQRAVLRSMPTAIGSVGLAARYVSANAEALVGGDLYEVAETPYGVRVIVGDVRGKGLEAVQTATTVLGAFRAAAFTEADPGALAMRIDETMSRILGDEEFVTAIVGQFEGDRVTLANCGHHPPVLVQSGSATTVDTGEPTVPLGMGSVPTLSEHPWPRGARMLFYTDGLVEARDDRGEFFSLDDYAAELGDGTVEEALDGLVAHLLAYAGHALHDDMALVLAECEGR
ncbi:PP2C family protein-serine/threonine phosphatase [Nocardioides sp. YIM 152315]|uniref:PP2C family protein-serine/threonine phosphatase n=1 Tax=Nocardioides sp. YIM 152315 TaxID=3031760 RepID=UPI0023DAB083|nr:PP2C family protein-serine/threonine phosphatase [Nocardioides sp. YIM 152315]MDF1603694.1 PP2C family protein-serine/threonine phosphatase [Nocardioides sp. YIM 152315]